MEMMPYHPTLDETTNDEPGALALPTLGLDGPAPGAATSAPDWRQAVPVLVGPGLTLREVRHEDAAALFTHLTTEEVARFISPPPADVAGFERFIAWSRRQRAEGKHLVFAVVPEGQTTPVGMFQVRLLDAAQHLAEWGFVLGSAYWGTGLFVAGARLVLDFVFGVLGLRRLEARAAVPNGRGNGALRKLGAVCEAVLSQSFERHGERLDQALWTLRPETWWARARRDTGTVH